MRQAVKIEKTVMESSDTVTLRFLDSIPAFPGQFVMAWFPGLDEIPLSLSYISDLKGITVRALGKITKKLVGMGIEGMPGMIAIEGPHGNHFEIDGEKVLAVAGGIGIASVITAIEHFHSMGIEVTTVLGAKKADELIFVERSRQGSDSLIVTTDDGSYGEKGITTEIAEKLLEKEHYDSIIACGPEPMLEKIAVLSDRYGVNGQFAIERIMKCGLGICDSCAFGGYHVCTDGPVFTTRQLKDIEDFGKWRRDFSGRKVDFRGNTGMQ